MITLTKEWLLKTIAELEEERDAVPGVVNEDAANALAAMKLALASLEAEPVAWDYESASYITCEGPQKFKHIIEREAPPEWAIDEGRARNIVPLYTAPPAPVSVAEEATPENVEMLSGYVSTYKLTDSERDIAAEIWNACRAAMLQGAEPVTTAYKLPDDFDFDRFNDVTWLEAVASNPHMHSLTTSTIAMVALELNKRLEAGNSPAIQDGWVLVPVEPTAEMISSGITAHYDRNQIQIHDRPAPGPMECAYVAMLAAAPQQEA